jgi:hypothetical protein
VHGLARAGGGGGGGGGASGRVPGQRGVASALGRRGKGRWSVRFEAPAKRPKSQGAPVCGRERPAAARPRAHLLMPASRPATPPAMVLSWRGVSGGTDSRSMSVRTPSTTA